MVTVVRKITAILMTMTTADDDDDDDDEDDTCNNSKPFHFSIHEHPS